MSVRRVWTRVALIAVSAAAVLPAGCRHYSQDSPEAVIASAKEMVSTGHADRLTDLIYADSKEMRQLLDELGKVLGTLQGLATEVQKAFPEEIEAYKKEAVEAAKKGEASNFLQQISGQALGGRRMKRPKNGDEGDQMRSSFDLLMKEVFADPYGWLERSEGRLSVKQVTDDTATVLWDQKPLLGVGLSLKLQDGKWFVQLPLPANIMPKSADSWEIVGEGLDVVDNMLKDLKKDVQAKRVAHLEDLAHSAGEKAFVPAALIALAYGKVQESEKKERQKAAAPTGVSGAPAKAPG
jgi:hypothetical protein